MSVTAGAPVLAGPMYGAWLELLVGNLLSRSRMVEVPGMTDFTVEES